MVGKFKNFVVRKRITLSFLFAIFFVMFVSPPSVLFFIIGLEMVFFGEAVRIWASGYLRKGEMLAVNGPYAYVRHPLYLGNFLIGTGFCVAGQSLNFFMIFLLRVIKPLPKSLRASLLSEYSILLSREFMIFSFLLCL